MKVRIQIQMMLALLLLISLHSSADVGGSIKDLPQITKDLGKPYIVKWADGSEAELKISKFDSALTESSFKVTESTCGITQNATCLYRFRYRLFIAALVWTKYSDPTRVGQVVERGYKYGDDPAQYFSKLKTNANLIGGLNPQSLDKISAGLPAHEIECKDFSWLRDGQKEAPASVHFSRWSGEENEKNSETETNENRTSGSIYGLGFNKVNATTLRVFEVGNMNGTSALFDLLTISPTMSLTTTNETGGICQIGVSSNLRPDIIRAFNEFQGDDKITLATPSFINGENEILDHPLVKGILKTWFSKSGAEVYK